MPQKVTGNLHDFFENKARAGDASFAIAYALMELAHAQRLSAEALDRMGLNSGSPEGRTPGTLEKLAMEAQGLSAAVHRIADALERGSN
jgi:hypothetical protein